MQNLPSNNKRNKDILLHILKLKNVSFLIFHDKNL